MVSNGEYSDNVFINCPFDDDYRVLFNVIVFTIHECGFKPRCAKEEDEEFRLMKIENLIENCKYGIHDLSRTDPDKDTNLPRFNMPFELGLFVGCKRYGNDKNKRYLVLDIDEHRYEQFISDLKGVDIKGHNNQPQDTVRIIRDWLRGTSRRTTIPGANSIWSKYQLFTVDLPTICRDQNLDVDELTFAEYSTLVYEWLKEN